MLTRGGWMVLLVGAMAVNGFALVGGCSEEPQAVAPTDAGNDVQDVLRPKTEAAAEGVCSPVGPLPRATAWKRPRPFQPSACSSAQLTGYFQSCLVSEVLSVCDAFKQQNPGCFECLDANEGDERPGALVWFRNRMVFDVNVAGCMGNVLGDTSDTGCPAVEGRYLDCRRLACNGCTTEQTPAAREALFDCMKDRDIEKVCANEQAAINVACADYLNWVPSDPIAVCFTPEGETFETTIRRYLSMWCGPPAPQDAGLDASQDADAD